MTFLGAWRAWRRRRQIWRAFCQQRAEGSGDFSYEAMLALDRGDCPACGKRLHHYEAGLSIGRQCAGCGWNLMTTNPRLL